MSAEKVKEAIGSIRKDFADTYIKEGLDLSWSYRNSPEYLRGLGLYVLEGLRLALVEAEVEYLKKYCIEMSFSEIADEIATRNAAYTEQIEDYLQVAMEEHTDDCYKMKPIEAAQGDVTMALVVRLTAIFDVDPDFKTGVKAVRHNARKFQQIPG